jgi:hypothetical protein
MTLTKAQASQITQASQALHNVTDPVSTPDLIELVAALLLERRDFGMDERDDLHRLTGQILVERRMGKE